MSWSFTHCGKDQAKLQVACRRSLNESVAWMPDQAEALNLIYPVKEVIVAVIDATRLPKEAAYLKVSSSGHVDRDQCYFEVTAIPIFLPTLVD